MPDWKGDYVYSVKLDHSKMKVIRNLEELKAFGKKVAKRIELRRKECDEKGRLRRLNQEKSRAEQGLDG
jgi:hypothetical protein